MTAMGSGARPASGTWSHSFEEDRDQVLVFRPSATFPFPPSRSPRTCLHFDAGGELTEHVSGADDRPRVRPGRWSAMGRNRYAYAAEGAAPERVIEIVEASPELLILRLL
ncbi:MAG: hypothetical protein V4754_00600 [Pseudomonadota bacterium]